jgi:hypothetical protein
MKDVATGAQIDLPHTVDLVYALAVYRVVGMVTVTMPATSLRGVAVNLFCCNGALLLPPSH